MRRCSGLLILLIFRLSFAQEDGDPTARSAPNTGGRNAVAPDIRADDTNLKLQSGDLVVVPVPISNPTIGTGLVGGGAYFHAQTEAQKKEQPASVTAVAGLYTSSDSFAYGIAHQHYWDKDRWRFSGAFGRADMNLRLLGEDDTGTEVHATWLLKGNFAYAHVSRLVAGGWYAGLGARVVDMDQRISGDDPSAAIDETDSTYSAGLGIIVEHDRRDMPFNSYAGHLFQLKTLFNSETLGSDAEYQSYAVTYRSYHEIQDSMVLAWEVQVCKRVGDTPLWDACKINLRGFAMTDYLGKQSTSGQAELRWRFSQRWGVVGFAGAGYLSDSLNQVREREWIPSYGLGVRFMVLQAKRINLRLDYARSTNSSAVHVSVTEAF